MSERKVTPKKVFLLLTALVVAVASVVYLFIIFDAFRYRQEMAERKIGDEIINIHKGVPRGWAYSVITDQGQIGAVGSLGQAVAQVDFSLPELNEKLGEGLQKKSIYFYSREVESKIEQLLTNETASEQPCKPSLYHQTHDYLILTTSCASFSGEKYLEYEQELKKELQEFWFQFQ
jgi:hypothetical protein